MPQFNNEFLPQGRVFGVGHIQLNNQMCPKFIVFIQLLYANAMQMIKLNSLLEATRELGIKDISDFTIRCVQKLFLEEKLVLELRHLNHTGEPFLALKSKYLDQSQV